MKLAVMVCLLSLCASVGVWGSTVDHEVAKRALSPHSDSSRAYISELLDEAYRAYHSSQAVLVTVRVRNDSHASLVAYAHTVGHWRKTLGPIPAVVGKHGITLNKHEGDLKSPAGIFYLGPGFGSAEKSAGIKLPYTRTSKDDYWIDDPTSADYNRWVAYAGDRDAKWKSYERLLIPAYQYAVVVRYNMYPVIKGRGSAIFLHISPGPDGSTAGCTAVSTQHLLALMKWLDPIENPVIIQGTADQLKALSHSTPNPRPSLTKRQAGE